MLLAALLAAGLCAAQKSAPPAKPAAARQTFAGAAALDAAIREAIDAGRPPAELEANWQKELSPFLHSHQKFWLYE